MSSCGGLNRKSSGGGTVLPNANYAGELLQWDGSAWVPIGVSSSLPARTMLYLGQGNVWKPISMNYATKGDIIMYDPTADSGNGAWVLDYMTAKSDGDIMEWSSFNSKWVKKSGPSFVRTMLMEGKTSKTAIGTTSAVQSFAPIGPGEYNGYTYIPANRTGRTFRIRAKGTWTVKNFNIDAFTGSANYAIKLGSTTVFTWGGVVTLPRNISGINTTKFGWDTEVEVRIDSSSLCTAIGWTDLFGANLSGAESFCRTSLSTANLQYALDNTVNQNIDMTLNWSPATLDTNCTFTCTHFVVEELYYKE